MRVWRVSRHSKFDGEGARRFGGRWHRPGTRVVYLATTLALATLEFLAHVDRDLAPGEAVAHYADLPDDISIDRLDEGQLPAGWNRHPAPDELQDIGTRWALAGATLLLSVPSAVLGVHPGLVPGERNLLVNAVHSDFPRVEPRIVGLRLDPRVRITPAARPSSGR